MPPRCSGVSARKQAGIHVHSAVYQGKYLVYNVRQRRNPLACLPIHLPTTFFLPVLLVGGACGSIQSHKRSVFLIIVIKTVLACVCHRRPKLLLMVRFSGGMPLPCSLLVSDLLDRWITRRQSAGTGVLYVGPWSYQFYGGPCILSSSQSF